VSDGCESSFGGCVGHPKRDVIGFRALRLRPEAAQITIGSRASPAWRRPADPEVLMCEPTPRVRWVLERARQEAREHGHDYVGTEHLLLALLADEDGIAKEVLATHADPAALRGGRGDPGLGGLQHAVAHDRRSPHAARRRKLGRARRDGRARGRRARPDRRARRGGRPDRLVGDRKPRAGLAVLKARRRGPEAQRQAKRRRAGGRRPPLKE
jgi:hypothetical protein